MIRVLFNLILISLIIPISFANEYKVKRKNVFEFTVKPSIKKNGDKVTVSFTSKDYCDVTIVIENNSGKILRHLASGVLGKNAPTPFIKNSLKQTVTWDGKDDTDQYIKNIADCHIRVSLGFKPHFEKNLLWSPKKLIGTVKPVILATKDGVYVHDGRGVDHIRKFSHKGDYIKTIYPFPAKYMKTFKNLKTFSIPQSNTPVPIKTNFTQSNLLTTGVDTSQRRDMFGFYAAVSAMAIHNNEMYLIGQKLNRITTDGRPKENFYGPKLSIPARLNHVHEFKGGIYDTPPKSAAISPDGKWLYLSNFYWSKSWNQGALHGITRMPADGSKPPELWKGSISQKKGELKGKAPYDFVHPTSICFDSSGNLYVSDYFNDRIQVFKQNGNLVKTIKTRKPVKVQIDPKTKNIYVFSWSISGLDWEPIRKKLKQQRKKLNLLPTITQYESLSNPIEKKKWQIKTFLERGQSRAGAYQGRPGGMHQAYGTKYTVEINFWGPKPVLWMTNAVAESGQRVTPEMGNIKLYSMEAKELKMIRDFGEESKKAITHTTRADFSRQRLYVNPKNEKLYISEVLGFGKASNYLTEINPENGIVKEVPIPFNAEDFCFDINGFAYLRTDNLVVRYNTKTWKEVPWDYGIEKRGVAFTGNYKADIISGLSLPSSRPWQYHQGGMSISPKGYLVVTCHNPLKKKKDNRRKSRSLNHTARLAYEPPSYPGRSRGSDIHVWDRHGKIIYKNVLPGLLENFCIGIDNEDSIYVMTAPSRVIDGKRHPNKSSTTLIKVKPKNKIKAKIISTGKSSPVKLEKKPDRKYDMIGRIGYAWVENAEWLYGGVGYGGFNFPAPSCSCWNTRFALDYLGRTFSPELDNFSIAVLDKNGNLILRMGQYGNVDSAGPKSLEPLGGDEIGLFHPAFIATLSDRNIYIADPGNSRISSIKVSYHKSINISLK